MNDDFEDYTLPRLLVHRATRHGGRTAMRKKEFGIWHDISWNEYRDNVRRVAMGLVALGIRRGECVAIISENRPEWLYIDLGIQSASGITAAVYTTNAPEQVAYVINHSESRFFFVEDEEQLDKALEAREKMLSLDKIIVIEWEGLRDFHDPGVIPFEEFLKMGEEVDAQNPGRFADELEKGNPDDTALLVYTSGTTGPPKGAMLSHRNLIWTAGSLHRANPIRESDEILSFLPLCHIAERMMTVVNQLRFGYTVNFAENLDTVPQNLREVSPTVFFAVPRIWEKFYSRVELTVADATWFKRISYRSALRIGKRIGPRRLRREPIPLPVKSIELISRITVFRPLRKLLGLERVRLAISGAAPISPNILEYFHVLGIRLKEVYGQTEGSGPTTIHTEEDLKLGTVGKPLPGVEVRLAGDGEILVRGKNVFKGYLRNPEASKEILSEGWLHSGDVGVFDDEGFLRITDRKKDLIITAGGKNIAPQNIENRIKFSPYINDAVVIGDARKYLTALILIDEENVTKYAQDHRIPFTTYADLAGNAEIGTLIDGEVTRVNRDLSRIEQIKKFRILEKRLDAEDGELTPTMKVKRMKISDIYRDTIEEMYADG